MSIKEVFNKAKREKRRAKAVETARKVGTGVGIGAAIGSLFGILFAPKSGKETRKDIVDSAKSSVENIKEGAGELGEKLTKAVEESKEKLANFKKVKEVQEQAVATEDTHCEVCMEAEENNHNED